MKSMHFTSFNCIKIRASNGTRSTFTFTIDRLVLNFTVLELTVSLYQLITLSTDTSFTTSHGTHCTTGPVCASNTCTCTWSVCLHAVHLPLHSHVMSTAFELTVCQFTAAL